MEQVFTHFWEKTKFRDILLLIFFIFSVKFSFLPLNTTRLVLLYIIVILCVFRKDEIIFSYNKSTLKSFIILLLYGVYTALITLYSGGNNIGNLANIILVFFQIVLGAYLLTTLILNIKLDQLLFILMVIFAIQGVLIFINFIFPAYREMMFVLMPPSGNITEDNFTSAFRTRGFMQSSGATVSSYLCTGFLIGAYFLTSFKLSRKDKRIVFICLPLILLGIVFTGRTGFIMIPFAFLAYYVLLIINQKFTLVKLIPLIAFPIISVLSYFILRTVYLFFFPDGATLLSLWEDWAFDQFLSNFNNSSGKTNTLEKLQTYLFIPEDDTSLLFGNPLSWGIIRTDLGYIRMLFSVGIIGSILFYGGFIRVFLQIIQQSSSFSQQILLAFILLWILLIEYKEPMFSHNYFSTTIMLMLFCSMKAEVK